MIAFQGIQSSGTDQCLSHHSTVLGRRSAGRPLIETPWSSQEKLEGTLFCQKVEKEEAYKEVDLPHIGLAGHIMMYFSHVLAFKACFQQSAITSRFDIEEGGSILSKGHAARGSQNPIQDT